MTRARAQLDQATRRSLRINGGSVACIRPDRVFRYGFVALSIVVVEGTKSQALSIRARDHPGDRGSARLSSLVARTGIDARLDRARPRFARHGLAFRAAAAVTRGLGHALLSLDVDVDGHLGQ